MHIGRFYISDGTDFILTNLTFVYIYYATHPTRGHKISSLRF